MLAGSDDEEYIDSSSYPKNRNKNKDGRDSSDKDKTDQLIDKI